MSEIDLKKMPAIATTAAVLGNATAAKAAATVEQDEIASLALQLADSDIEVARAAKRRLWRIVRHAGRPGATADKQSVSAELGGLLNEDQPAAVNREVLWMLSEIGTGDSVSAIANMLLKENSREDARMALERIPGEESLAALKSALDLAPDAFKSALAQSLRVRGVQVAGLPCVKLKATKKTSVKGS